MATGLFATEFFTAIHGAEAAAALDPHLLSATGSSHLPPATLSAPIEGALHVTEGLEVSHAAVDSETPAIPTALKNPAYKPPTLDPKPAMILALQGLQKIMKDPKAAAKFLGPIAGPLRRRMSPMQQAIGWGHDAEQLLTENMFTLRDDFMKKGHELFAKIMANQPELVAEIDRQNGGQIVPALQLDRDKRPDQVGALKDLHARLTNGVGAKVEHVAINTAKKKIMPVLEGVISAPIMSM